MSVDRDQTVYALWFTVAVENITGSGCGFDDDGAPIPCTDPDGNDPIAVREVLCIRGVQYVTTGRQQILGTVNDLRLSWYDLVTTEEGCCQCKCEEGGSGSGSGSGQEGCCPKGFDQDIPIIVTGPFGDDCEPVELVGVASYDPCTNAWVGDVSDGELGAVVQIGCHSGDGCEGAKFRASVVVKKADCSHVAVSGDLDEIGNTLAGSVSLGGRIDCEGAVSVILAGHPCEAGSGSGSGGGEKIATPCCPGNPVPAALKVTFTNKTGDLACLPGSMTFTYNMASGGWLSPPGAFACLEPCNGGATSGYELLSCSGSSANAFQLTAFGIAFPTPANCNPFILKFTGLSYLSGDCTGTVDITITPA